MRFVGQPPRPPENPQKRAFPWKTILLYRNSSSLPLPLLEGITVIGYWTRSSLARARLSIGDRFTPEKPLLDGQHTEHYTTLSTILPYPNSSLNFALYHAVSLVLAFHWRQIYPSLGCHQDAFDRKILQHPQDCHHHHCGIMAINFISLKSYHSQPLSHNTFLSHNKTGLFKWHQSTKQAN